MVGVTNTDYVLSVAQTSTAVSTANVNLSQPTNRMMWYVKNTSTGAQNITITLGKVAVAGNGFVLAPGDSISESNDNGYRVFTGTINAISDAVNGTVSFVER